MKPGFASFSAVPAECLFLVVRVGWGLSALRAERSLARALPGNAPGGAPAFFASPKKVGKERRPDTDAPLRGVRCGARPGREVPKLVPAVLKHRPFCFRPVLRSSPSAHGDEPTRSARCASPRLSRLYLCSCMCMCEAQRAAWSAPLAAGEERRAGRKQKPALSEDRRDEFAGFPASPSTAANPAQPGGRVGSPFFGYFLWRSKESNCAAGRIPRHRLRSRRSARRAEQASPASTPDKSHSARRANKPTPARQTEETHSTYRVEQATPARKAEKTPNSRSHP